MMMIYFALKLFILAVSVDLVHSDLRVKDHDVQFSSSELYQDVITTVYFTVTLANGGQNASHVPAQTDGRQNFEVKVYTTNADMSLPGGSDSIGIDPFWPWYSTSEAQQLTQGLDAGGSKTLTIEGRSHMLVPKSSCGMWKYVCLFVTGAEGSGFVDTESHNNYGCTDVETRKRCTNDHIDLSIQQFDIAGGLLYSGGFSDLLLALRVDISGGYILAPEPDKLHQDYHVEMYLSEDDQISEDEDLKIRSVPYTGRLTAQFKHSGSLYLGGPNLKLPELSSSAGDIKYCGLSYLGVVIDPGAGDGTITETNEDNNKMAIPIKVLCPEESWVLSDSRVYTEAVYVGSDQDIVVDTTVHNLQNSSYRGGRAAFRLALYLHDKEVLGRGDHLLELTRVGSVTYPSDTSPLHPFSSGGSLKMLGITFHIDADMIGSDPGYTHLILRVEPVDSSDSMLVNSYAAFPILVKDPVIDPPISVKDFGIGESRFLHVGTVTLDMSFILEGKVILGTRDPDTLKLALYWSKDKTLDSQDMLSDIPISVRSDGRLVAKEETLFPHKDASFCGPLYGILVHDAGDLVTDLDILLTRVLGVSSPVTHVCDASAEDELALMELSPYGLTPSWVVGSNAAIGFRTRIACTHPTNCHSKTAGKANFGLTFHLDTDQFDDNESGLSGVSVSPLGGSDGYNSDLSDAGSVVVKMKAEMTFEEIHCRKNYRYLRVKLSGMSDYQDNNALTMDIHLNCLTEKSFQLDVESFSLADDLSSDPSFDLTLTTTMTGGLSFPHRQWPHFDMKFYLSADDIIDPMTDKEIPYLPSHCLRFEMGQKVSASKAFSVTPGSEDFIRTPVSGFEDLCHLDTVYVGVAFDTKNLIDQSDEFSNMAADPTPISTTSLGCDQYTNQQVLSASFDKDFRVEEYIQPNSTYIFNMKIKVTNEHDDPFIGSGNGNNPEFEIEIYLSEDTSVNGDSIPLSVNLDVNNLPGTWDIEAGSFIEIPVTGKLVPGDLSAEDCDTFQGSNSPHLVVTLTKIDASTGFSMATSPGTIPVTLICSLKLEPTSLSIASDPVLWQDRTYQIGFTFTLTNQGGRADMFSLTDPNFDISLSVVGAGVKVSLKTVTIDNPHTQMQVLSEGESVNITAMGSLSLSSSDCSSFTSQLSIKVLATPSLTLQSVGYVEQEVFTDISSQVSVQCSDAWEDLGVESLLLQDNEGNEKHEIELGSATPTSFEIQVMIDMGPTSSSAVNYNYELHLSRTEHKSSYKLDYTPTHDELNNAVSVDTSHTLTGTDLTVPDTEETRQLCGAVYLSVLIQRDSADRKKRGVLPGEVDLLENLVIPANSADPQLTNNYISRQILLTCPGDLFALSDVTLQSFPVLLMEETFLEFSATVTNSHYLGYNIPASTTGRPNFTFKLLASGKEVGLHYIMYSGVDREKLAGSLPAGKSVALSAVRLVLDIDSNLCMDFKTDNWTLLVVPDVGLPAGFVDEYTVNNIFNGVGLSCNDAVYNFAASSASIGISATTLTIAIDVNIVPGSEVSQVPDPALELFVNGISYGNPAAPTSSANGKVATWTTQKEFETAMCGVLVVRLVIDPQNTVTETSEDDNIIEQTVISTCDSDLYGVHFEVRTEYMLSPNIPTTFYFDAEIYNMASLSIKEAEDSEPENFVVKLYAGSGPVLNTLVALDITPNWRYISGSDIPSYYRQAHTLGQSITLKNVHSSLSVPAEVCTLGYDHLFLTVEVVGATIISEVYEECVQDDNYISLPFQCAQDESVTDLSIVTVRSGKKLFHIEGGTSLTLGEEVPFSIEVNTLSKDPPPSDMWFDYGLYLVDDSGDEHEILHNNQQDTLTQSTIQQGRILIGGFIYLDPKTFLPFCVNGGSLRVRLDPDNLIAETDELNNEADITDVTITGGSGDYCNALDIFPTQIFIDPGNESNVIYYEEDIDFHFRFDIMKGTANDPAQFKYLAVISLDGDIKNPTNRNLTHQTHTLASGKDVTFTERISVFVGVQSSNRFNHLFCGQAPYIGVWINYDRALDDVNMDNNIIWRQFRLVCDEIDGLSVSSLVLLTTNHDSKIQTGSNTISMDLGILNKGTELFDSVVPGEDIFKLNMYASSANTLIGAQLLSVTWINDTLRDRGMMKWTVRMFTDLTAQVSLSSQQCTSMTHLCVEVKADIGMKPTFVDNFNGDDFMCYDLINYNITLDCGRDISVSSVSFAPVHVTKFYKDLPTLVEVNLTLGLDGQPVYTSLLHPHLGVQVLLSNRDNPQPTVDFNLGSHLVLANTSSVFWDACSYQVLSDPISSGTENRLSATIELWTQMYCEALPGKRYLCVEWLPLHQYTMSVHDPDLNNNHHCTDITVLTDCSQDTLDLTPVKLDLGDAVTMTGWSHDFNLDIQVEIGSVAREGPVDFKTGLYFSLDRELDPEDYKLDYKGFEYADSASEMRRHLVTGENHINIGGSVFSVDPNLETMNMSFCGDIFVIAVIDIDEEVQETIENNNMISAKLTIVCKDDAILLSGVVLAMSDRRLYAEEDSILTLNLTVRNMRNLLIPEPSSDSALYNVEVYAVSYSSGTANATLISGDTVVVPAAYYRQMLPLERVHLSPVDIQILAQEFTQAICTKTSHLKVVLIPGMTDNIPNHDVTIPLPMTMKSCTSPSENGQLYISQFQTPDLMFLPAQVPVHLAAVSRLWVGGSSVPLPPNSFITSLYISRDRVLDVDTDYLWRVMANEHALPPGVSTVDFSRGLALPLDDGDLQFCGHAHIVAVLDSDNDLTEPSQQHLVMDSQTVFICPNDVFGISDVQFATSDNQLVENEDMTFTLNLKVTCTKLECHIERTMENVIFTLETQKSPDDSVSLLSVIDSQWSDTPGQGVEPSLGASFLYTGHIREFTVQGSIKVGDVCSDINETLVTVRLSQGVNLTTEGMDFIPDNNEYTFLYKCVSAKGRDLKLLDLSFFTGPEIYPGTGNPFSLPINLTGEAISPVDVTPTLSPFRLSFWLSADGVWSEDDMRLMYELSECVSKVLLQQGLSEGEPTDVQDYAGLFIPDGFCGTWYIIVQIDSKNEIQEISEDNNFMTTKVVVKCQEDVLHIKSPNSPDYLKIQTDSPVLSVMDLVIENIGSQDLPACSPLCQQLSVVAILSEDTQYDPLYDESMELTLTSANDMKLAKSLHVKDTMTLKGVTIEMTLNQKTCSEFNFLLVGVLMSGEYTITEDYLENNFVVISLHKHCDLTSLADLAYVTATSAKGVLFMEDETFLGKLEWTGKTVLPSGLHIDPYMAQIWLSADEELNNDRDIAVGHENIGGFRDIITASGSQEFNSVLKSDMFNQSLGFCGRAYVIVEIDPRGDVIDRNKRNNIGVKAMPIKCVAGASSLTQLTADFDNLPSVADMFGVSEVSMTVESDGPLWPDQMYAISVNLSVNCHTDCPSKATHTNLTSPVHFNILLKVYDADFVEITSLSPDKVDADWVAMAISDDNELTNFSPGNALQSDFTIQDTLEISFSGLFSVPAGHQCWRVRYVGVSLSKGDSDQVKESVWGITQNDLRFVPLTLKCQEEPVDLQIDMFSLRNPDNSPFVTLDLTSLSKLILDLVISSATGFWPKSPSDKQMFDYKFYISDTTSLLQSQHSVDMMYSLPEPLRPVLSISPPEGATLNLSDSDFTFRKQLLAMFCGLENLYLNAVIEYNVVVETREDNNMASIPLIITGCQDNFDIALKHVSLFSLKEESKHQTLYVAGDTDVYFDLGTTFSLTNVVSVTSVDVGNYESMKLEMVICDEDRNIVSVLPTAVTSHTSNKDVISPVKPGTDLLAVSYTGSLHVPGYYELCHHSWLLRTTVEWEGVQDNDTENNIKWSSIYISCPDDQLALESIQLGLDLQSDDFELWPLLPVEIPLQVTVRNQGGDLSNATAELFYVSVYYSVNDTLEPAEDHMSRAQYHAQDFVQIGKIGAGEALQTDWITGVVELPTLKDCDPALHAHFSPTLFIVLDVLDPSLSEYTGNDIIRLLLREDSLHCVAEQVDLFVSEFSLPMSTVSPNIEMSYTLRMGIRKTESGIIPQSDPSDPEEVSIQVGFFISLDESLSNDDVNISVSFSNSQMIQFRLGVPKTSLPEYTLDGEGFMIDLQKTPSLSAYCGMSYLLVLVNDTKNQPNIDPNLRNNIFAYSLDLSCESDSLALEDFTLASRDRQEVLYTGVDVEMDFSVTIRNYQEPIARALDGRPNFHLKLFISPDSDLDVHLDSEVPMVKVPDTWHAYAIGQILPDPIDLSGQVTIHLPFSACTSHFIILALYKGVDVMEKDSVILNNMRYIYVPHIACSVEYIDISVKNFQLLNNNSLVAGDAFGFILTSSLNITGDRTIGDGIDPVFAFQFYLSTDESFDNNDTSLDFTGKDQMSQLTQIFTSSVELTLDNMSESLKLPPFRDEYCGRSFLLVVLDVTNVVEEISDANNVKALPVIIACPRDILDVDFHHVQLPDTFYMNWASVSMSLSVTNVGEQKIHTAGQNIIHIKVTLQRFPGWTEHDITPSLWNFRHEDMLGLTTDLPVRGQRDLLDVVGHVDITSACWPVAQYQGLETGSAILKVKVILREDIEGSTECVMSNNAYQQTVQVNCHEDTESMDLRFTNFTVESDTLKKGLNSIYLAGETRTKGISVGSNFKYSLRLGVQHMYRYIATDTYLDIVAGTFTVTKLPALTPDMGLSFLCSYPGSVVLTAVLASPEGVTETSDLNNQISIHGLSLTHELCQEGVGIWAVEFKVTSLDVVVARTEEAISFAATVALTNLGPGSLPQLSGDATHFSWVFVLSSDDTYDHGVDVVITPENMEPQQVAKLQREIAAGDTTVLTLEGSNLAIPLNKETHPFCWEHPYVGIILDQMDSVIETTETNNAAFYRIVLDCGDALDECSEGLDNCSEFAECSDLWYNLTTYSGEPYQCACSPGFQGDGWTCTDIDECAADVDQCSDVAHSQCYNYNGSFECSCMSGYESHIDSSGDTICINVDECADPNLYTCHENATCEDTEGSYECSCLPWFLGDGVFNCTDNRQCTLDSCSNGGTCVEGLLGVTCLCAEGYRGPTCQGVQGHWSTWSDWSQCKAECGPGHRSKTRSCTDPQPINGGLACSRAKETEEQRKYCQVRACAEGHVPWCDYNPCFEQSGGMCLYEDKGTAYTCECAPGYEKLLSSVFKFRRCEDVDECTALDSNDHPIHDCGSNATCLNSPGSFSCSCDAGYYGDGYTCEELDECQSREACPEFADCVNTPGSFVCSCQEGYIMVEGGDRGFTCIEQRLLPYGETEGDKELVLESMSTLTRERVSPLIPVPHGLPLFDGQLVNSVYISENGLLVLTDETVDRPDKETYRYPTPLTSDALHDSDQHIKGFLAPFWTDCSSNSIFHKVWYQIYTDKSQQIFDRVEDLLEEGLGEVTMELDFILKVTWHNMAPAYMSSTSERNTFQVFLATDYVHTYVSYVYENQAMNWRPLAYNTTHLQLMYRGYPVRIGYIVRGAGDTTYSEENEHSARWSTHDNKPNAYRVADKIMQSHQKKGWLFYQLDNNPDNFTNPRVECINWYQAEEAISSWSADILDTCPPSRPYADRDHRMSPIHRTPSSPPHTCYRWTLPNSQGASFSCCYNEDLMLIQGSLSTDYYDLGLLTKSSEPSEHQAMDRLPYQWCCEEAKTREYCKMYMEKRPLMTASNYQHLTTAWIQGSVHMVTLDGAQLDLLGFGEYVWLHSASDDVMIQIRTSFSQQQVLTPPTAVIVSGVAAKIGLSPSLQAYVSDSGGLDVWVDDGLYTGQTVDHAFIESSDNQVVFVFEAGISLIITVTSQQLAAVIQVPSNMKGLEGLLGNMDGLEMNDFITAAGDSVNVENSRPEDMHTYTETWALRNVFGPTNAESHSLFYQYDDPASANTYFTTGFSPVFYSQDDYTKDERQVCTIAAEVDFGCLYDIRVTGSISEAQHGLNGTKQWTSLNQFLKNQPPVFAYSVPKLVEARVGISESIELEATDPEGDRVTLSIYIHDLDTGIKESIKLTSVESENVFTASYQWIPEKKRVHLIYEAADSSGSISTLSPMLSLCACENHAICDHDLHSDVYGNFHYGLCTCHSGHTGQFCEEDFGGCSVKHCFGECIDRHPAAVQADFYESEFSCEACPQGMEGTGLECYDLNECVLPTSDPRKHNCSQTCENKVGGFRCTCLEGYMLLSDRRSCVDMRECGTAAAPCDPKHGTCTDSQGSFTCGCQQGFVLAEDGVTCEDINECLDTGKTCNRLCVNTQGSYHCECGYGYTVDPEDSTNCVIADMCTSDIYCNERCVSKSAYYECQCSVTYDLQTNGWQCLPDLECQVNQCDLDLGICAVFSGQDVCLCPKGYQLSAEDGKTCRDINECLTGVHQCGRHSSCVNDAGSYHCDCDPGYQASMYSDKECVDIDECGEERGCTHYCENTGGTYRCDCHPGYLLLPDLVTCVDVDECAPGVQNDCDGRAFCHNYNGYHTCTCMPGYTGLGSECYDLNECDYDNGGCQGDCHNTHGSFFCSCAVGYVLHEDGFACEDFNECLSPQIGCSQGCDNTEGSYLCTCWEDFSLSSNGVTCQPNTRCSQAIICGVGGVCTEDSEGGHCVCDLGYQLTETGICQDVDECTTRPPGHNVGQRSVGNEKEANASLNINYMDDCVSPLASCVNTNGGYLCTCVQGYELRADGISCVDVDECIIVGTERGHQCNLTSTQCVNQPGGYGCECSPGFRYSTPHTCVDVDECDRLDMGGYVCDELATCNNNPGSYACSCGVGYTGDGLLCTDIDECSSPSHNTCQLNQTCVNTLGSFYCICEEGYKYDASFTNCLDIDECFSPLLNKCRFSCENLIGSYRCTCPDGYQLDPLDGHTCRVLEECVDESYKRSCYHECVRYKGTDKCVCYPGYTRVRNKCLDIDECTNRNPAYSHQCGVNSVCDNQEGNYTCECGDFFLPDVDGLACTESDGMWSEWSMWTLCSRTCNGRRTRERACDSPPSTVRRACPGDNIQYDLCGLQGAACASQSKERDISVSVFFPYLITELWESVEDSFNQALCKSFDTFCWADAFNYKKCCNKPLDEPRLLSHYKKFCSTQDILMSRGYPTSLENGTTSVMIYIKMPLTNDLCGTIGSSSTSIPQRRRKRSTVDSYLVPRELLQEVLNSSQARDYVYQAVRRDSDLADRVLNYSLDLPESLQTTAPPVEESGPQLMVIIMAVLFSLAALIILAVTLYCLLRKTSPESEKGVLPADVDCEQPDFSEQEAEVEEDEDEMIRRVLENISASEDSDESSGSLSDMDSEDSELRIFKQHSTLSTDSGEMQDETATHPNRPMLLSPASFRSNEGRQGSGMYTDRGMDSLRGNEGMNSPRIKSSDGRQGSGVYTDRGIYSSFRKNEGVNTPRIDGSEGRHGSAVYLSGGMDSPQRSSSVIDDRQDLNMSIDNLAKRSGSAFSPASNTEDTQM